MTEQDLTALAHLWANREPFAHELSPDGRDAVVLGEGYLTLQAERDAIKAQLEGLVSLVVELQGHANEQGWQDVDDPIAALLEWTRG